MAFDFPASPALNDEYSSGGVTYKFNGLGWAVKSTPPVASGETDANLTKALQEAMERIKTLELTLASKKR